MSHSPRVFVSASADRHLDEKQLEVKYAILRALEQWDFELWRYYEEGPLRRGFEFEKANEAMRNVHGAIVLAFAQWECQGLGPRKSEERGFKASEGNHLEGGLAIAHGLPLLVVRERGTQERGVVSEGGTHDVVEMPRGSTGEWVSKTAITRPFRRWCEDVKKRSRFLREKRVFIGHGHSPAWEALRNFVEGELRLSYDEFNRISTAGISTVARLSQILDESGIAFLVMTAEDEQKNGGVTARSNVVHEVGLVQGRLGFQRAIVLLEDGCQDFSNIHGIGHIPFSKGDIASSFDKVRAVLRREDFLD